MVERVGKKKTKQQTSAIWCLVPSKTGRLDGNTPSVIHRYHLINLLVRSVHALDGTGGTHAQKTGVQILDSSDLQTITKKNTKTSQFVIDYSIHPLQI